MMIKLGGLGGLLLQSHHHVNANASKVNQMMTVIPKSKTSVGLREAKSGLSEYQPSLAVSNANRVKIKMKVIHEVGMSSLAK